MISAVSISSIQQPVHVAPASASTYSASSQPAASSQFAASYSPQVYAVYLNGISAGAVASGPSVLETDVYASAVTVPGDAPPEIPSLPPIDGSQQVIQSLTQLAGSGRIFSGSGQTVAASTGAVRSSAFHSSAHVASR
jgi:hypothetical protein